MKKVNPYTLMSTEFEGFPKTTEIKPLVRMVLTKFKLPETHESLSNIGQILILLKRSQGVAELEILKHIQASGDSTIELKKQAAISAVYLSKFKK
jgi:hypothetical protein